MSITVEAIYENGTLKLSQPLPLKEQEKVQVTVHTVVSRVQATYGLIGWKGDLETLERVAEDPEFGIEEAR